MVHSRVRLNTVIEYNFGEQYFLYDPDGGARAFVPDSPEWFAWLVNLSSFHFKSKQGHHFTARQEKKQRGASYWYAYRKAHGRQHKRYLGSTEKLTLTHLEDIAETLHEEALGSFPEDEVLNTRQAKPTPHGLTIGSLTILWDDGILTVKTPTERHVLNRTQATELLNYLYAHRRTLLKQRG